MLSIVISSLDFNLSYFMSIKIYCRISIGYSNYIKYVEIILKIGKFSNWIIFTIERISVPKIR